MNSDDWKLIVSGLALVVGLGSLIVSFKVRKDGLVLKLTPKFSLLFSRANRNHHYDAFNNRRGPSGIKIETKLSVHNPSPYVFEIIEIISKNYLLVNGSDDFKTEPNFTSLQTVRFKAYPRYQVASESETFYFLTLFISDTDETLNAQSLPELELCIRGIVHKEKKAKPKSFQIKRPIYVDQIFNSRQSRH